MEPAPRKILVIELAGLGDNVHLLPALGLLRGRWPGAELHVMAFAPAAGLFALVPWVQRVWAYPFAPRPGLVETIGWAAKLRRERYDAVFNTTGSDRSSLLAWATGAPLRVGRRPADGGPWGWRLLYTRVLDEPYYESPMYRQKWRLLRGGGFAPAGAAEPRFDVSIDPALRRAAGIEARDERRYVHVSPFTSSPARELPGGQVAAIIEGLRARHPGLQVVLSCSPTARERAGMTALLARLREPPWKVFAGTLDIPGLAAVIEKAALSLSGDTGTLHLAFMTGTPAVAWFRAHRGQAEWIPDRREYRVLVAEGGAGDALHGIDTREVLEAADALLARAGG